MRVIILLIFADNSAKIIITVDMLATVLLAMEIFNLRMIQYHSPTQIPTGDTGVFTQSKRMYYYSGSILPIEWTNQHGCGGNSKVSCEIILQYACEDTLDPRLD